MAMTSSYRPLPLLRRPLPPKVPPPSSATSLKSEDRYLDAEDYKVLSKSSDFSTSSRYVGTKSKVISPVKGIRFHGDVPLPSTSVVKPYKSKGPDPLPPRPLRKPRELPLEGFIKDSYVRPPPEFTLRDFVRRLPSRQHVDDDGEPMVSEQNYEKLTSWFAANKPNQSTIHSFEIDSAVQVPDVTPRVPARQLLIEMQFQSMDTPFSPEQDLMFLPDRAITTVLPITPAASKLTIPVSRYPTLPPIETPVVENDKGTLLSTEILVQKDVMHFPTKTITIGEITDGRTVTQLNNGEDKKVIFNGQTLNDTSGEVRTRFEDQALTDHRNDDSLLLNRRKNENTEKEEKSLALHDLEPSIEYRDMRVILPSSQPEYFQGEELPRTASPFVSADVYDAQISPIEAVILNAMMTGSSHLNLRAHFLNQLPNLSTLAGMLTHLNLTFNDFWVFPHEILELVNLVSLKMRDNPIKEIPHGINMLKRLRVFEMSFNLLTSLPSSLFELEHLELLDLAYNRLSFIPSEISSLSSLRELNLEGNQLGAMPVGALHLNLKFLRIKNNFIHPLLWRETANNQPQRLGDMSALAVIKAAINYKVVDFLPKALQDFLGNPSQCDCCGGPLYGQGLRVIRAPREIFGIKNLPFLFRACSQICRKQFAKDSCSIQQWFRRNTALTSLEETD